MRFIVASMAAFLLAFALSVSAQQRVEPIVAGVGSPAFATLDVANGTFSVFGPDDAFARSLSVREFRANQSQLTGRVQVFAVSGGDATRANYVCATSAGVLFGSGVPCGDVRFAAETR